MRGLLIVLMSLTLAATGFAQSRHGSGGSGSRVGGRSFAGGGAGGAMRGGFAGGGFGRGFVNSNRGFAGAGRMYTGRYYGGYGYGAGLGYSAYYAPSCYDPYYYGGYNCGYPVHGYYAAPMARMGVPYGVMASRPAVMVGGGWRRFGRR
jgi:hypothetical protein